MSTHTIELPDGVQTQCVTDAELEAATRIAARWLHEHPEFDRLVMERKPADKWAAEKAAFAAGKPLESRRANSAGQFSSWSTEEEPQWRTDGYIEYRVKPWQLTSHIEGFRPIADGEEWHRQDWTEEMLPQGWRPLLHDEVPVDGDEAFDRGRWRADWIANQPLNNVSNPITTCFARHRTRRPLPALNAAGEPQPTCDARKP